MKKIGMIGGLSYASSVEFYRKISEKSNQILLGHNTMEIIMISVNPTEIFSAMHENNWEEVSNHLISTALKLEMLGAECILIPCNTVHKVADTIKEKISVDFISILDAVGEYSLKNNYTKVGLIGTSFTMEDGFYQDYLYENFNIKTTVPDTNDKIILHKIIFNELCKGEFNYQSKLFVKALSLKLCNEMNCDAVILGCTELPLILNQNEIDVPLVDTISVQADYAIKFSMGM